MTGLGQKMSRADFRSELMGGLNAPHALDEPSGNEEKAGPMMILDKCAQEFHAYMDECDATGASHFAFRSTRK